MSKFLVFTSTLIFSLNAFPAIKPISYSCDVIETPSGTNDSWNLTFYQDYVVFFDNDQSALAKFTGKTTNLGDSVNRVYRSVVESDPFRIILGDTFYDGKEHANEVYEELYIGKAHRPFIFSCSKYDAKEALSYISDVTDNSSIK